MSLTKLKENLKNKKPFIGFDKTLKGLKNGEISMVFLANNCPDKIKDEVKSFEVEIIEMKEDSEEIAMVCKRQHNISVISF